MKLMRIYREQKGWSQAALAEAASVPRATVSAIETGRVVPSVETALAIAHALDSSVEALFAAGPSGGIDRWASPAISAPVRFWLARVADRMIAYPAEALPTGSIAHDGVLGVDGGRNISPDARPDDTLVLATCDPAVGLLAEALRARNVRLIALSRPSREALRLLRDGLVHAAGVHFSNDQAPDENKALIFRMFGDDPQVLLNYAE